MARGSSYRPNRRRKKQLLESIDAAVYEATEMLREAVWQRWMALPAFPGYKSGEFATGEAADLQISPIRTVRGKRSASVFSPAYREGSGGPEPYPVYWELGHLNVFTARWEEQPLFRPALEDAYPELRNVVARIVGASPFGGVTQRTGGISVREP